MTPLVGAAERICWLTELIASYDACEAEAEADERAALVAANPDLRRFLDEADRASDWDRDRVRAEVGAGFILESLSSRPGAFGRADHREMEDP
jgi:hypothetical protein